MAESATFALKAGVWFRRGRLLIVSPDSRGTACPLSGRNSTYRPVQISAAGSYYAVLLRRIQEINDDPATMREVVYEAARLALRWQVAEPSRADHFGVLLLGGIQSFFKGD